MNLVEKLLNVKKETTEQLEEKKMKSIKLAQLLGEEEVEITIREIQPQKFNHITAIQYGENGDFLPERVFDTQAMLCAESIVEPELKDKNLQEHFGCNTPKDLAIKLFKGEITKIATQINKMCMVEDAEKK